MNLPYPIRSAAAAGVLVLALIAPSASFAHDQACHPGEHMQPGPAAQGPWVQNQMDKEAAWLEIKASQQTAWEAYSAANIELLSSFGNRKPLPPDIDAANAIHRHAENAAAFAQSLAKLADATDKLQSVLSEDQRKVLDRIVRMHSQFQGGQFGEDREGHERWHHHHGDGAAANAAKSPPKAAAPAKPKN